MSMNKNLQVLIAGAGIGGLAAACLLKRGFRVRVFEQAQQLGEIGAGIQLSANAVKVLFDLGLQDRLEQVTVKPKAFEFRRFECDLSPYPTLLSICAALDEHPAFVRARPEAQPDAE